MNKSNLKSMFQNAFKGDGVRKNKIDISGNTDYGNGK